MLSAVKLCQSSSISGTGGDSEAHVGEDFGKLVHHLGDRVDRARRRLGRGQRQVHAFGGEARFQRGAFECGLACGQGTGDFLA
jgi:hypothetical protein